MNKIPEVSVTLTKVGVNFGDHGQDVITSVALLPGETVEEAATRLLHNEVRSSLKGKYAPDYTWYLTIRLIEPAPMGDTNADFD